MECEKQTNKQTKKQTENTMECQIPNMEVTSINEKIYIYMCVYIYIYIYIYTHTRVFLRQLLPSPSSYPTVICPQLLYSNIQEEVWNLSLILDTHKYAVTL